MAVTNMNLGALLTAENLVEPSTLEDALEHFPIIQVHIRPQQSSFGIRLA